MTLRVRRALEDIQKDYAAGDTKALDDLMRAWKGIKDLPADDPNSFFMIGGYHGEPFRGGGWGSSAYWGGYCNHGNVLFPTWHRAYLLRIEDALRSIPGCSDVTLPYWDETSEESLANGVPWALTRETYTLDGVEIPNPLRSFVFNRNIVDHLSPIPDANYSKPIGYETVRYPLSGLVGTEADRKATALHNAQYPDYATNVELMNKNVVAWLTSTVTVGGQPVTTSVRDKYAACLEAPNYTVFSNTTSQQEWNDNATQKVRSLESPHNSIHLAVGGFDLPGTNLSVIAGANGDMGENDTAGLDPIFFFHHCFVDRVFWLWQQRHDATFALDIIAGYPGTNSADNQGPTPGVAPNSWLTMESPLDPFRLVEDGAERAYTSRDCVNIEVQMGYTYGPGSTPQTPPQPAGFASSSRSIRIDGINRGQIRGSFVISAFAVIDGQRHLIDAEAVLSRWNVSGCANCQTHIEAKAVMPLRQFAADAVQTAGFEVEVRTRDGVLTGPPGAQGFAKKSFHFEII